MESIKDRVAIVGMGLSKFGENWDKSADDLVSLIKPGDQPFEHVFWMKLVGTNNADQVRAPFQGLFADIHVPTCRRPS